MKSVENKFGKQQSKTAKLGTENRKTQDVKPITLNAKQETSPIRRPNNYLWCSVLSFECALLLVTYSQ